MPYPGNGVYVVMGEMSLLLTTMKRGARWPAHSHQDEEQDSLVKSFHELKDVLSHVGDLMELEPNHFLGPFLEVIRSEETTGPVTCAALASVDKFISYGLIAPNSPSVAATVENIADAVIHARFVGTDPVHDSVVLMKILQLLRTLMLSPVGVMLSNESVTEILLSCFRFCFEDRLSELLRKTAEHCLKDMVQLLFLRLPSFSEDLQNPVHIKKLKMRAGVMDSSRGKRKSRSSKHSFKGKSPPKASPRLEEGGKVSSAEPPPRERPEVPSSLPMQGCTSPQEDMSKEGCVGSPVSDAGKSSALNSPSEEALGHQSPLKPEATNQDVERLEKVCCGEEKQPAATPEASGHHIERPIVYPGDAESSIPCVVIDVEPDCPMVEEAVCRTDIQESMEGDGSTLYGDSSLAVGSVSKSPSLEREDVDPASLSASQPNSEASESASLGPNSETVPKSPDVEEGVETSSISLAETEEYVNPHGVRFTPFDVGKEGLASHVPYNIICVRELFLFLVSLCNPNEKQNTEVNINVGLKLLTVAMEVGSDAIGSYTSLLSLVKDDLSRNLLSLLASERLTNFAANLQVAFLLFESLRTHLKFQMESYLVRLSGLTTTADSTKVVYEKKEVALESLLQFWRIPGFVTELYVNYDCDPYCCNLFEDLTDLLSKNAYPVAGLHNTHLLSLSALLSVVDSIEFNCRSRVESEVKGDGKKSGVVGSLQVVGRKFSCDKVPSHEQLMAIKHRKELLSSGTEHFNSKPSHGIQVLQENGLLSTPLDPQEVALFFRENPMLDKNKIGEYISNKKNLKVLECFVKSFDFGDLRIDEALRLYLETFRLPGEAIPISLVLEQFADHWHNCNGKPFVHSDAAFTLAYAVIMLNVDQHNYNAKKQSIPMTSEDFMKNLKGVNGGKDFEKEMLEDIYNAIKNEEIVMPAEQTGIVRENYLWKVLLRRGASKEGAFIHTPVGLFDHELFTLIRRPTVAALCLVFDKSNDPAIFEMAITGFKKCALISAHYGMSNDFDSLVISLCKFTTLLSSTESMDMLAASFGENTKAQLAAKTVFGLVHRHGDILRDGWKNVLDCIIQLFKCKLLPKSLVEADDFIEPSGKIPLLREETPYQKTDTSLFSSLYSYIALSPDPANAKVPSPEDEENIKKAQACIQECHIEQLITESKFLRLDSLLELVKALIFASHGPDGQGTTYDEDTTVFFLELLLKIVIQNRDRVGCIWQGVRDHIYSLLMGAAVCDLHFLMERSVVGLLRLASALMRREDMSPVVLQSLRMLLLLKSQTLARISRQIAYGLFDILKTSAANIHSDTDWSIIFTLLECVGAGAHPPRIVGEVGKVSTGQGTKSDGEDSSYGGDEDSGCQRTCTSDSELYSSPGNTRSNHRSHRTTHHTSHSRPTSPDLPPVSSGGWILVGREGEIQPLQVRPVPGNQFSIVHDRELLGHDPYSLVKCCESLAFLVRDLAHITPYNFENCVHCIRTFVEASLNGNERRSVRRSSSQKNPSKSRKKAQSRKRDDASESRSRSSLYSSSTSMPYDADESDSEELPGSYHQVSIQLLDLMHTLHTRTAQIFRWWSEEQKSVPNSDQVQPFIPSLWSTGWCPLLQGMARLCCDSRRQVRMSAITYLQRGLLFHDLQTLTPHEWESCFNQVLFPLLTKLLEPVPQQAPAGIEETRMRAATVLSKVFLHHLSPLLSLPTFTALWLTILDFMDKYMHAEKSDLLYEAIPESLKNMLLVMDAAKVFSTPDGYSPLWTVTWDRINTFLPSLKEELFKSHPSVEQHSKLTEGDAVPLPFEGDPSESNVVSSGQQPSSPPGTPSLQSQPTTKDSSDSPQFSHVPVFTHSGQPQIVPVTVLHSSSWTSTVTQVNVSSPEVMAGNLPLLISPDTLEHQSNSPCAQNHLSSVDPDPV
ncbi:Golgi-specific brefeldin A-resistance guanine nucleotide exchange factor 1 isoform X2 [Ischnura elegans]|uniref:Golgi-specific brefeldin A-resistance guanine nucleotide exchange factor 1 isoform X2 n=1 Tax=Ischnura elegans TaxID=197161 RepID=UPI001ED89844|nr:Golgi-specific brefeldin A-resistance guanine nucleotide exchange factor 1 isoform X2 [Ischnura elegans]